MKSTTKMKMVASKIGITIESGESVEVTKPSDLDNIVRVRTDDGRRILVLARNAHKKLTGFVKEPSMKVLEKWINDSTAKSITGKKVEPDGYDEDGFPSWLLVLGLI